MAKDSIGNKLARIYNKAVHGGGDTSTDPLNEAAKKSLNRVIHHFGRYDTGIITAFRSGLGQHIDPKTGDAFPDAMNRQLAINHKNNTTLKLAIRDAGFSFFPVIGHYYEATEAGKQLVEEESLFVIDKDGKKNLREFLENQGRKYNQDSVLFKPAGSNPVLIGTNDTAGWIQNGEVSALGAEAFNQPADVYSKLHGNRTFHFKSVQVEDHVFDDIIKKEAMAKLVGRKLPDRMYP